MTICTSDGMPITAADPTSAVLFDEAVESYLGSRADTPALLQRLMAQDPDHLMAPCMMGYLTRMAADPGNSARSRALYQHLHQRIQEGAGSDWERGHIEALGLWLADATPALIHHLEALTERWPRDTLALRLLHYLYFYEGDAAAMHRSVAARLPGYRGHPLEGYVRGMLAFALEECGEYGEAEAQAREAVAANERDLWAAHALAHVMQMQRRLDEGVAWVESLRPRWEHGNNFRWHLSWHQALFHLGLREFDAALALYDREVGPAVADDFYLDMCNAASLLLRLEGHGVAVGDRWQALARVAERHVGDRELVFASLHHLIPLLVTGSESAAELLSTLERWSRGATAQGQVLREAGHAAAEFLVAVRSGQPQRALALFEAFEGRLHRIGGSHAQRELFGVLALDTAARAGEYEWAADVERRQRLVTA